MAYPWRDRGGPKLLVVGIDGIPFDRLSEWATSGTLPNTAELLSESTYGPLESTIPPATSPAWQVCLTGKNPGKIGIFGFAEIDPFRIPQPAMIPIDSTRIAGQTFLDYLSRANLRVIARQVRCCYPAWEINGCMQTGFPTPSRLDPRRFWPPGAAGMSRLMDHRAEKRRDTHMPWGWFSLEQSLEAYLGELRKECDVLVDDLRRMDFDCYVNVIGATDGLQHLFWLFSDPFLPITSREQRLFGDAVLRGYRTIDRLIARILDVVPPDVPVMFVSDHGATREATRLFRLNHWLASQGWLTPTNPTDAVRRPVPAAWRDQADTSQRRFARERRLPANRVAALRKQVIPAVTSCIRAMLPETLTEYVRRIRWRPYLTPQLPQPKHWPIDMSRTQAYGYGFGECCAGVAINLRGRQESGIVEPGAAYDGLCHRLVHALTEVRDPANNRRICRSVWRREELYSGPYADQAPDVVLLFEDDYKLDLGTAGPVIDNRDESQIFARSGEHSRWGVCIGRGLAFRHRGVVKNDARILDIAPTALALMGVPVPDDMDGHVLDGWLNPDRAGEVGMPAIPATTSEPPPTMSEDAMARVAERLRDLGYIE